MVIQNCMVIQNHTLPLSLSSLCRTYLSLQWAAHSSLLQALRFAHDLAPHSALRKTKLAAGAQKTSTTPGKGATFFNMRAKAIHRDVDQAQRKPSKRAYTEEWECFSTATKRSGKKTTEAGSNDVVPATGPPPPRKEPLGSTAPRRSFPSIKLQKNAQEQFDRALDAVQQPLTEGREKEYFSLPFREDEGRKPQEAAASPGESFSASLELKDVHRVLHGTGGSGWLGSQTLGACGSLIRARRPQVHWVSSEVTALSLREEDIVLVRHGLGLTEEMKGKDHILLPLNKNNEHWGLLVLHPATGEYTLHDPLADTTHASNYFSADVKRLLEATTTFSGPTSTHKNPQDGGEWQSWRPTEPVAHDTQQNGRDCGVFVCLLMFAYAFTNRNLQPHGESQEMRQWLLKLLLSGGECPDLVGNDNLLPEDGSHGTSGVLPQPPSQNKGEEPKQEEETCNPTNSPHPACTYRLTLTVLNEDTLPLPSTTDAEAMEAEAMEAEPRIHHSRQQIHITTTGECHCEKGDNVVGRTERQRHRTTKLFPEVVVNHMDELLNSDVRGITFRDKMTQWRDAQLEAGTITPQEAEAIGAESLKQYEARHRARTNRILAERLDPELETGLRLFGPSGDRLLNHIRQRNEHQEDLTRLGEPGEPVSIFFAPSEEKEWLWTELRDILNNTDVGAAKASIEVDALWKHDKFGFKVLGATFVAQKALKSPRGFPMAFALVQTENVDSVETFITQLNKLVIQRTSVATGLQSTNISFVIDKSVPMAKGVLHALSTEQHTPQLVLCRFHMKQTLRLWLRSKLSGEAADGDEEDDDLPASGPRPVPQSDDEAMDSHPHVENIVRAMMAIRAAPAEEVQSLQTALLERMEDIVQEHDPEVRERARAERARTIREYLTKHWFDHRFKADGKTPAGLGWQDLFLLHKMPGVPSVDTNNHMEAYWRVVNSKAGKNASHLKLVDAICLVLRNSHEEARSNKIRGPPRSGKQQGGVTLLVSSRLEAGRALARHPAKWWLGVADRNTALQKHGTTVTIAWSREVQSKSGKSTKRKVNGDWTEMVKLTFLNNAEAEYSTPRALTCDCSEYRHSGDAQPCKHAYYACMTFESWVGYLAESPVLQGTTKYHKATSKFKPLISEIVIAPKRVLSTFWLPEVEGLAPLPAEKLSATEGQRQHDALGVAVLLLNALDAAGIERPPQPTTVHEGLQKALHTVSASIHQGNWRGVHAIWGPGRSDSEHALAIATKVCEDGDPEKDAFARETFVFQTGKSVYESGPICAIHCSMDGCNPRAVSAAVPTNNTRRKDPEERTTGSGGNVSKMQQGKTTLCTVVHHSAEEATLVQVANALTDGGSRWVTVCECQRTRPTGEVDAKARREQRPLTKKEKEQLDLNGLQRTEGVVPCKGSLRAITASTSEADEACVPSVLILSTESFYARSANLLDADTLPVPLLDQEQLLTDLVQYCHPVLTRGLHFDLVGIVVVEPKSWSHHFVKRAGKWLLLDRTLGGKAMREVEVQKSGTCGGLPVLGIGDSTGIPIGAILSSLIFVRQATGRQP